MSVAQINDKTIINELGLPPCMSKHNKIKLCIVNGNVYVNGLEFKNGKWKPTLQALWHWLF